MRTIASWFGIFLISCLLVVAITVFAGQESVRITESGAPLSGNATGNINMSGYNFTVSAGGNVYYSDDVPTYWGSSNDASCKWDTAPATDFFHCDVGSNEMGICNGACTVAGHSPMFYVEGVEEVDGIVYLDGGATLDDVLAQKTATIADGDATPDISGGNLFVTSANTGATAITDLDNPTVGQVIAICGGSNTNSSTIADSGNFALNGAMTLSLDSCIVLYAQADNDYVELGRNNVSLTPWTSNIDADTYDLQFTPGGGPADVTVDERGITGGQRTTDSTGQNLHVNASDLYPFATQSTTAPVNLILRGGLDAKQISVLHGLGGCTGADTVIVTRTIDGTVTGPTTLTYGTDWCNGGCANDGAAATSLASAIDALSGVGATATVDAICPGGAAGSSCVGVTADRFTSNITLSQNDATCTTLSVGVDGQTLVSDGDATNNKPGLAGIAAPTTGLVFQTAYLYAYVGGAARFYCSNGGTCTASSALVSNGYSQAAGDILGGDDFLPTVSSVATDAPPVQTVIQTELPYQVPTTAASTNRNGGDLILSPGQGKIVVGEIVPATIAGKTITLTVTAQGSTAAGVVYTEGAADATHFHCDGHTAQECALDIYNLLKTGGRGSLTGCVVTCLDGTCSNGQIAFGPSVGVSEYCAFATNDYTALPLTTADQGVDGAVRVTASPYASSSSSFKPQFQSTGSTVSGFGFASAGIPSIKDSSGNVTTYSSGQFTVTGYVAGTTQSWSNSAGNGGYTVSYPTTITCTTSGDGNHSTCGGAQALKSNDIQLVCEDADGCTLTINETGPSATTVPLVVIHGPVANHVDMDDQANVLALNAALGAIALDAMDTLTLSYDGKSMLWTEVARSAN